MENMENTINTDTSSNDAFSAPMEVSRTARQSPLAAPKDGSTLASRFQQQADAYSAEQERRRKEYLVELDDDEYDYLERAMSNASTPAEADALKFKYAAAKKYSKTFNKSMEQSLDEIDGYTQALFANSEASITPYTKPWYTAVSDSFTMGTNQNRMSDLGNLLMHAEAVGDTEQIKNIMEEYKALEEYNGELYDRVPRNFFVDVAKFGAEMLPTIGPQMAISIGFSSLGGVGKLAGAFLGFVYTSTMAQGRTYMDLRNDGCSPELASKIAKIDGNIEGAIEQVVGLVAGAKAAAGRLTGKAVTPTLTDKITKAAVSRIRNSGAMKTLVNTLIRTGVEGVGEGIEEVLQDLTNIVSRNVAASMEKYDIGMTAGDIAETLTESFKGGFGGALLLGAPMTAINVGCDIKDIKALKEAAEVIPSKEVFVKTVKEAEDSRVANGHRPILAEMDEDTRDKVIGDIYDSTHTRMKKKQEKSTKELSEIYTAEENTEVFADMDENGNDIEIGDKEIPPEYRTKEGRLYSTNEMVGDGKGQFKVGDGSHESGKVYGYINYSVDEDTNTITIDSFKTTVERGNLRNEMFMEFAKQNSGYAIKWNPKGKYAKEIKQDLVSLNPYGKEAGLSYFKMGEDISKQEQEDSYTRSKILSQIAQHMDVKADERAPMLAVFEQIAKHNGMSISDMFYGVFDGNVFGKISQNDIMQQADQAGAIRGGIRINNIMGSIKATIYAAENADFSTWNHELAHLYRSMMQGEELVAAEKAFGVKDGNWTRRNEEDFAVGLEEYLRTGKVKSGALNEMYQKIVEFMARVYNGMKNALIKLSPEMEKFFDSIIESDNEVWVKAQEAVKNADTNRSVQADINQEQKADAVKDSKNVQPKNVDETIAEGMNAKKKEAAVDTKMEEDTTLNDMSEENRDKVESIIEDDTLDPAEKKMSVEEIAAEQLQEDRADSLRNGGNTLSEDDMMDLFQFVGPNAMRRVGRRIDEATNRNAMDMYLAGRSAEEIYAATKRRIVDGKVWYDTKDGDFRKFNDIINIFNALGLLDTNFANFDAQGIQNILKGNDNVLDLMANDHVRAMQELQKFNTIYKLYNAPEVYEYAPYLKDKKIAWKDDPRIDKVAMVTDAGIVFNIAGISDLAGFMDVLRDCLDDFIQADEKGEKVGLKTHTMLDQQKKSRLVKQWNEAHADIKLVDPVQEAVESFVPEHKNKIIAGKKDREHVLFQAVFHGSPHIIRRPGGDVLRGEELGFDHSKMGTGEGAQAYGWGTYVTEVQNIANDYARKLSSMPYTEEETKRLAAIDEIYSAPSRINMSIESKKDFVKHRKTDLRNLDNGKYEARILKNIKEFTKELKAAKKDKDEQNIKFYADLIATSEEDLNQKKKEYLRKEFQNDIDKTLEEIADLKKKHKDAEKKLTKEIDSLKAEIEEIRTAAKARPAENVYTLDIPDDSGTNYLDWNEKINIEQYRAIIEQAKKEHLENFIGHINVDLVMADDDVALPTGKWLYSQDLKFDFKNDKEKSLFLNRAGFTGIKYPANNLAGGREDGAKNYVLFNENDITVKDWHAKNVEGVDLFQKAYHGSGANFDRFDLNYGFSGEGSMSFGYGVYVSGSEDIARDYAERQASKYTSAEDSYNVLKTNVLATIRQETEYVGFEKALDERKAYLQRTVEDPQDLYSDEQKENAKKLLEELNTLTEAEMHNRHLYTVEIPDNGYIVWDKQVRKSTADRIKKALLKKITTDPDSAYYNYYSKSDLMQELDSVFSYMEGQQLYRNVSAYLEGDEKASNFLKNLGYVGIDYPAGTNFGNGRDARNYVIFVENDAKITQHDLFQTEPELMQDAASFDNWQEFMDFYESFGINEGPDNVVPGDADADYYRNVWELAHRISPTTEEREQQELDARKQQDRYEAEVEKRDPVTLDNIFMAELRAGKGRLETFLAAVNEALSTDAEAWRRDAVDDTEAAEAQALIDLQNRIRGDLKHGTWISNVQRLSKGKGLTDETKKRMLTLIRNNVRQYRALYADIMNEPKFAVTQTENQDIVELAEAGVNYADMSIEERGKMAGKIRDERVSKQIEDGTLVMGPEFQHYLDSLEAKERKHARDFEKLKQETKEDYNRITSKVERDILKKYEELQNIREQMEFKKIPVPKELEKGIAKAAGYTGDRSALSQSYNRIWKEYDDLLKSIEVTAKFKERLAKFDAMREAKAEMRIYREEKETAGKIRDMQKKLVKRTMRKVSFNTVDYENARMIIAIQDVLEPNLFSGVNRWLGVEKAWARDIWSSWKTDEDYRKEVTRRLEQSERGQELLDLLGKTKTEQQFILWKDKDRNSLERMLATKDWKKELKLLDLQKERAGAIQLDVAYKATKRNVYNEQGDYIGEEVFNVAEVGDELAGEIEEKIGTELYENMIHKPWEDWTIGEVEDLAKVIDDLYREGRDSLKARRLQEKLEAASLRDRIAKQVATTKIVINDDDSEETKRKKQKKINKILGVASGIPGTSEVKTRKRNILHRFLHGYHDANVRRVARILDGWKEGTNTSLLYWKENDCFERQERSKNSRIARVGKVLDANGITTPDLYRKVKIEGWLDEDGNPHELTVDEILFFAAASRNNDLYRKEQTDLGIDPKDCKEESSYKAVVYGNLMPETEKEKYRRMDEDAQRMEEERRSKYQAARDAGDTDKANEYAKRDASHYDVYGNLILEGRSAMMIECKKRMKAIMDEYDRLDGKYKALQDAIAEDYSTSFDRMNRASIEEFNIPVWREKWYLPLIRLEAGGETHESRVRADLLGHNAGTGAAGTEKGFTKKRVEIAELNQKPVETGLYSTWADSVERTEHFIAYSGYVRELNRVYMNRDAQGTMQNIKNRYGDSMTSYIQEYIKEVANPSTGNPVKGFDKVIRALRGNTAPAYLSWKLSSVLKQAFSSPAPFLQFVSPWEYGKAAMKFIMNSENCREAINQKSVFMKNRRFDPLVDLIDEQKRKNAGSKARNVMNDFNTLGMQGLEWIDYMCVAPGWLAVYEKENARLQKEQEAMFEKRLAELKAENDAYSYDDQLPLAEIEAQARAETTDLIEEMAVKKADDCTRLCQPSNRKVDLAPMFKNGSELAKAVLQFQTALNVIWQNIRYDIPYAVKNRQYRNIVGMVGGYVMAGLALGMMTEGFGDDDDDAQKLKKTLYWSLTQFSDSVPVLGSEITSGADRIITGNKNWYSGSDLFAAAVKYKDAIIEGAEGNFKKAAARLANGLALTLGLPASGAKELGRATGIGDGDGELEFHPEAFMGRQIEKKKK